MRIIQFFFEYNLFWILISSFQVAEKPEPITIDVDDLLQKVKKPSKLKVKAGLATADKNSK